MNIKATTKITRKTIINKATPKSAALLGLALAALTSIAAQMPAYAQAPNSPTATAERQTTASKAAFWAGQRAKKAAHLHQLQLNQAGGAHYAAQKAQFYAGQRAKAAKKAAFWANYYKTHPKSKPVPKK